MISDSQKELLIKQLARRDAIAAYPSLPLRIWISNEEEYEECFPESYAGYVLTLTSKSYRGHFRSLGMELTSLTKNFGFDKLIFLGDIDSAWRKRKCDFKPAKEALQYLKDNKVGKRFNGALEVNTSQLPEFIRHLSWLVRTNAVFAYVHFTDTSQSFIGSICQYGNLHLLALSAAADSNFKNAVEKTKFEFVSELRCYDKFSKSGAIKGRQIAL